MFQRRAGSRRGNVSVVGQIQAETCQVWVCHIHGWAGVDKSQGWAGSRGAKAWGWIPTGLQISSPVRPQLFLKNTILVHRLDHLPFRVSKSKERFELGSLVWSACSRLSHTERLRTDSRGSRRGGGAARAWTVPRRPWDEVA